MKNVLVLGANGRIARRVVDGLAADPEVRQTLFVRDPAKLASVPAGARVVTGERPPGGGR